MPGRLIRMQVNEVRLAVPAAPGVEAAMVTLGESAWPHRQLHLVIAQPEARAINTAWTGEVPARPGTWDLTVSALSLLDGRIERAVITHVVEDRHWYAEIEIATPSGRRSLTCRPSDAIALALRSWGAQIVAREEVLVEAGVLADGTKPGEAFAGRASVEVDPGHGEGTSFI